MNIKWLANANELSEQTHSIKEINKKACLMLGIFAALSFSLRAQENKKTITMEEAVASAITANPTIQTSEINKKIAEANYKQTCLYAPQVDIKYNGLTTNNPLNAFGYKLMQQSITSTDFNPNLLNNPKNTNNFFTSFDIQEAILNLDMIMQHKAAATQVSANIYTIQRTKEQITFETKKAYFNLTMTYKAVKVLEDALISSKAQNKLIDDRFKQGLINKSDLLNTEIQVKNIESQLSEAQSNIINASDYLSILMGVHIGIVYEVNESSNSLFPLTNQVQISQNRADFMAMGSFIKASSLMSKSYKYKLLPRLNAFGSYYLNDKTMLGFGSNSYLAGFQFSWNLLNGGRTRGMIQAQNLLTNKLSIQLEDKKNQDQLELNKTLREIEDLKLKIERQQIIIEQANEVYDLVNDRNKQGLSLTSDLLLAQTQLIQQKLLLEQLITSNNILHVYVEFLTASSN